MAIQGNGVQVMSPLDERLASLPQVPRRVPGGDGTEPKGPAAPGSAMVPQKPVAPVGLTADEKAETPIVALPGKTLQHESVDAATKFMVVEQLVRSQDVLARNRYAIDTHFRRVRSGVPFSRLEKIPNQSVWVQKLPTGMSKESSASVPNKADDLCNKVEDTLMADPPKPSPEPHVNDESAEEAAEMAAQFLSQDGGESGTNDIMTYRWALNNGLTCAASYCLYVTDRAGGGYQPLQKLAHPLAEDPSNPLVAMVPTGQTDAMGQPEKIEERAVNPVMRYVSAPDEQSPGGRFVQTAAEADRVWLPKIKIERYRRESVRVFPPTASLNEAAAVVFIRYMTLADARTEWPDTVGQMSQEELFALANWRPVMGDIIVPFAFRGAMQSGASGPSMEQVGTWSPLLQKRMFAYRFYVPASPEYPGGYWLDVTGANGGTVLGEGDLEYTVTLPVGGKTKRCRDIPASEVRPMQDVDGGDPTGFPFISRVAGGSEAEATLYAAFQDMCDNMLHPHVFLPSTQTIDEEDWLDRTRPITYDPSEKGPTYEQFPQLPPILPLIQNMDTKLDTMSGLTATAQGLDSSNATSGVAKNLTIRQAQVALSGFQQNLQAAMTRGWRIKCQIVQAEFTTPQLMQFAGEEGSAQPRWWTGEDLAGVDRVGIQPGTGTMMTPEAKANYVAFLQAQNWMTPDVAKRVALPGIKMDLGIPEDPYEQAFEREKGVWLQGPTDSWKAASAARARQMQTEMVTLPEAPMPPLPGPFQPKPNDGELGKATVYARGLSELFESPDYDAQPPEWKQIVIAAYQRFQQALVPPAPMPAPGQAPSAPAGAIKPPAPALAA